jgi:ATP-dependent DNA helicase RecG
VPEVMKMEFREAKDVELKEKYTKSLLKTVSAFSNFHDGNIYIGINDQGEVVGLPEIIKEKMVIENSINTTITPKPFFDINLLEINKKNILEIKVYKGDDGPYYYQNTAYMRNDTSTIPVDGSILTRLILNSKNLTYDQRKVSQSDLKFNYLQYKMSTVLNVSDINQAVLTTLGLFSDRTYNNGALLLSDNGGVSQSFIDIARFKLDTNTFIDRIRFENQSILQYFDQSMNYFQTQYPSYQLIDGVHRTTKEQVPLVAFREALSNAIIHRDYLLNSGVQLSMFENRIEIVSPGGLPEGIDEDQYFRGLTSLSRNPIIANVFFRLKLIEQFGTGIKRIIDSYKHYKIKPSFDIRKSQIRIILPVTNFDYTKIEQKIAILSYLNAFPNSSRQSVEDMVKIEKSTLIRRLNEFEEMGLVAKKGNGPSTVYFCR